MAVIATDQPDAAGTGTAAAKREQRRALAVGCGAHALHDGYTGLIYVMLPIWQSEFGLAYAAIGMLRAALNGTMAAFQIPSGLLADRFGAPAILAAGTALAGLCFCLAGASVGFVSLIVALIVGGLGASTQHPVASALVARAFAGPRAMTAIGAYNFAGDIGNMILPVTVSLLIVLMPWRAALTVIGVTGFVGAIAILVLTPRFAPERVLADTSEPAPEAPAKRYPREFKILLAIGIIDTGTRAGFLVFLPFLLTMNGASLPLIGAAVTLVFVGGAAGKLVCVWIANRLGVIATVLLTETLTAAGIAAVLLAPVSLAMVLLPLLGIALNGTSSVLYGSVPKFIAPEARTRAFGIFYTGTIGAGAVAPVLYGTVGDAFGVSGTVAIIAAGVLLTLPLALSVRRAFAAAL